MADASRAAEIYDRIGGNYSSRRGSDPRWVSRIQRSFVGASSLINVGAGTGSYEPDFVRVVGLEPSRSMIRQRPPGAAPAIRGVAGQLPFAAETFDVGLAVMTVHHWPDAAAGLAEMRRVSRKQVIVTWDPEIANDFWLVRDYLPEVVEREKEVATLATVIAHLGPSAVENLPVPADCSDGFLGAYWCRPQAYLDPTIRSAISGLALLEPGVVSSAMARLEADLADGSWSARYADLTGLNEIDLGYRLVVSES